MKEAILSSMTGYARHSGGGGSAAWTWEIKTVNAKSFDLRLRLPQGFDGLEAPARVRIAARIKRGTVQAGLTIARAKPAQTVRVNRDNLAALLTALSDLPLPDGIARASLDGLLAVPGVVETVERADDADEARDFGRLMLADLEPALDGCIAMRRQEGDRLGEVLRERLAAMKRLIGEAEATPGRSPEAVRARLARKVAELGAGVPPLDPVRLHQEAILMAAKADIREELDRLVMHQAAAVALLDAGGPVGRRLDFLAQELGREAGTLCAKANDGALSLVGLDLRTEIDQFREQVQNLE